MGFLSQDVEQVIPGALMYKVKDSHLRDTKQAVNNNVNGKIDQEDTFVFDQTYEGDTNEQYEHRILWDMVVYWVITHSLSLAGLVAAFTVAKWQTNVFAISLFYIFLLGIPAGNHLRRLL